MVSDFNSAGGIAVDIGCSGELAMAGFTAVNANARVVIDNAIGHQDGAGVDDFKTNRSVESDLVIAVNIAFRGVEKANSYQTVMADDVRCTRSSVTAIQDQMGRGSADSAAQVVGYVDSAIQIESAAAHADAGPRIVGDGAVGDVGTRIDSGDADSGAVLNRVGIKAYVSA